MAIRPKIKAFVEKLQGLPEDKKKVVLWITMAVVGLILGLLLVGIISKRMKSIDQEEITKPFNSLMDQVKLPDEAIDRINEATDTFEKLKDPEVLKQLEEELNNIPPDAGEKK